MDRGPRVAGGGTSITGPQYILNLFLALVASFAADWVGGVACSRFVKCRMGATFGVMLLLMKKEYWGTFLSTKAGKQYTMNYFLKGEDDATKKAVLHTNKGRWVSIYPQVKDFVLANWARRTKANFIARIPPDMIPTGFHDEAESVRESVIDRASVLSEKVCPEQEQGLRR